ncbi:MAG: hypothetical protein NC299_11905 [Lachnospiraceae bacterium]|nr:hypothetical protein [Lachnospiraceae bacterium]
MEFTDNELLTLDTLAVKQIYQYEQEIKSLQSGKADGAVVERLELLRKWLDEMRAIRQKLREEISDRGRKEEETKL